MIEFHPAEAERIYVCNCYTLRARYHKKTKKIDLFHIHFKYQIDRICSGMLPKAEMRATVVDGRENIGKLLHRNRNCFTQPAQTMGGCWLS